MKTPSVAPPVLQYREVTQDKEHPYPGQVLKRKRDLSSSDTPGTTEEDKVAVTNSLEEATLASSLMKEQPDWNWPIATMSGVSWSIVQEEAIRKGEGSTWHKPLLDIDFPAKLVPSSTPGHFHLFLDKKLTWENYKKLLSVLAEVGIIEPGYYGASLKRGSTDVRLPWIKKDDPPLGTGVM